MRVVECLLKVVGFVVVALPFLLVGWCVGTILGGLRTGFREGLNSSTHRGTVDYDF